MINANAADFEAHHFTNGELGDHKVSCNGKGGFVVTFRTDLIREDEDTWKSLTCDICHLLGRSLVQTCDSKKVKHYACASCASESFIFEKITSVPIRKATDTIDKFICPESCCKKAFFGRSENVCIEYKKCLFFWLTPIWCVIFFFFPRPPDSSSKKHMLFFPRLSHKTFSLRNSHNLSTSA